MGWLQGPAAPLTPPNLSPQVEETPSGAPPEPPASLSPEEDEDQWEDVSEEEEEDEGGSPGSSSEAEAPRSASPPAQRPPRTGPLPPSTPPSPFSPLGGHQPVWDWGEEMDLASPRSSLGDSPLSGPTVPKSRGAPGETPGKSLGGWGGEGSATIRAWGGRTGTHQTLGIWGGGHVAAGEGKGPNRG